MGIPPQHPPRLVFGPFEVNVPGGELRKRGVRIRLAPQPFAILLALLEQPGEIVSRDDLRQRIWTEGTFVDFDRGLNSAMAKLRRALGDSGETPRYIETVPARGYRFIGSLDSRSDPIDPAVPPFQHAPAQDPSPTGRQWHWWWLAPAAACLVMAFVLGLRFDGARAHRPWKFTQVISGVGHGNHALSPDGKWLAYTSEPGLTQGRDLYVRHVGGGDPIRLTFDGAENVTPNFSPDGARVVFRSNRGGGGIYQVPAFGGDVRLVALDGMYPKFSPDGLQVAFWIGAESVSPAIPGSGAVWVVPIVGGEPHRVGSKLTSARHPIWSPDGKHLLMIGYELQRSA
jgi:DNA-binding winged helix-turn-helix (wHTH) protein